MNFVTVTQVTNYFDPMAGRRIQRLPAGRPVTDYMPAAAGGYDLVAMLDGLPLTPDRLPSVTTGPGQHLVFSVVPAGGGEGGKNPLRTVAMLAVIVVAAVATYGVGAYAASGAWAWNVGMYAGAGATGWTAAAGIAAGMAVSMAGSLLINAAFPQALPDIQGQGWGQSATYGWGQSANPTAEGSVWPVLYGTARVTAPIIGKYIETCGDDQYLNLLLGVADHGLDAITGVRINDQSADTYGRVQIETRLGRMDQDAIPFFADTRVEIPVGALITTDWITRTTTGTGVQGLGIGVVLPAGLWHAQDDGSLAAQVLPLDIEISPAGAGTWTRMQAYNLKEQTAASARWSAGYYITDMVAGVTQWVELAVGSGDPGDHYEWERFGGEIAAWTNAYIQDGAEIGQVQRWVQPVWRWIPISIILAPGTVAYDYVWIEAAQTAAIRRMYFRDNLTPGQYDIRIRLHSAMPAGARYGNAAYFESFQEIVYDDFAYPGASLLAVRALATSQLSGGLPVIDCLATRATVQVWDGSQWLEKPANNPAWAAWDLLHAWGAVAKERIVADAFSDWADYCDEKGLTCNIYFDAIVTLRAALDRLGTLGLATVVQLGSRFTVVIDRPEPVATQRFLFTPGNIAADSWTEEWLPAADRANAIDVTYYGADNGRRITLQIQAPGVDDVDIEIQPAQIDLIGCTDRPMAILIGTRLLNHNRYCTLTAAWSADIDAIGCMPGDVVDCCHDVPQFGFGGRLVSAAAGEIVIDREVTLSPGVACYVSVKLADDSRQLRQVAAVLDETVTDTLTVTADFSPVPAALDLYAFGPAGRVTKPVRIVRIGRGDDLTRRITAIEYNDAVFTDADVIAVPESASLLAPVSHLRAVEVYRGGCETGVFLSWSGAALRWQVYYRRGADAEWIPAGDTARPQRFVQGLDYGPLYTFAVSAAASPDDAPTVQITLTGKTTAPGDVGPVTAAPIEDGCRFAWPKVEDFDLAGYQVRTGAHWAAERRYQVDDTVVPTDGTCRRYRCTAPGVSGAVEPPWPESGELADGSLSWIEDSAAWPWVTTDATTLTRELDTAEKAVQGAWNLTLRIWVCAVDAFGNVSAAAATQSAQCLNQKGFVSVGLTSNMGVYADIAQAVAAIGPGKTLYLKNGVYTLTGALALPAAGFDIQGESRDGVIIQNAPGESGIDIDGSGSYQISNLTLQSQNGWAQYGNLLNIAASPTLSCVNLAIIANDHDYDCGDTAIHGTDIEDSATIVFDRLTLSGGRYGADFSDTNQGKVQFVNSVFSGQHFGARFWPHNLVEMDGCKLLELKFGGISLYPAAGKSRITNNRLSFTPVTVPAGDSPFGISIVLSGKNASITGNQIDIIGANPAVATGLYGISVYGNAHIIDQNIINICLDDLFPAHIIGIEIHSADAGSIGSNTVHLSCGWPSALHCGLHLHAVAGCAIWCNRLNSEKGEAQSEGIHLTHLCTGCRGQDNIITNFAADVVDLGAGNTINSVAGDVDGGSWA